MFILIPTVVNAGSIYEKATVKDQYNNKYFVIGLSLREQKKLLYLLVLKLHITQAEMLLLRKRLMPIQKH